MNNSICKSVFLSFMLSIHASHADVLEDSITNKVVSIQSASTKLCAAAGGQWSSYPGKPIVQRACADRQGQQWEMIEKISSDLSEEQYNALKLAYLEAGRGWINAFNAGDAAAVASFYEDDSVMSVKSNLDFGGVEVAGIYRGIQSIEDFYAFGIDYFSLGDVRYVEPRITFADEKTVFVSAYFVQNNIGGFIDSEVWVLQDDGSMKLRYDEFSIRYFKTH